MSRHRQVSTRRRRGRVPVLVVVALALTAGMLAATGLTSAAFTDSARLSTGVGTADVFDTVLVAADGAAHEAQPHAPLPVPLPEADQLVPGRTVETTLTIASNHPTIAAALTATLGATPVAGTPDITPYLRITVLGSDGEVLVGAAADRPQDGALPGTPADLGVLAPRGAAPVADGATWTPGADGSARTVTVRVHLLDAPATEALNGGTAHLTATIVATSTEDA